MASFSDAQDARTTLCPRCGSTGPHHSGPGAGPHYQRLLCGQCSAFLRWLPKPRSIVPVGEESLRTDAERRRALTTWQDVAPRSLSEN
jgi:hypothetical protein